MQCVEVATLPLRLRVAHYRMLVRAYLMYSYTRLATVFLCLYNVRYVFFPWQGVECFSWTWRSAVGWSSIGATIRWLQVYIMFFRVLFSSSAKVLARPHKQKRLAMPKHVIYSLKSSRKVNFAIFKTRRIMNLTIGSRSRRRVVVWVQVWYFWLKVWCRGWISDRFGRIGSDVGRRTYEAKFDGFDRDSPRKSETEP